MTSKRQQLHDDELDISAADVTRLLAAQVPTHAHLPVARVANGGTVNAMFRVGDQAVARLPLTPRGVPSVRHEQRWLPHLAPQLPVAVPEVLHAGTRDAGYPCPWSLHRWMPGTAWQDTPLAEDADAARLLAGFVEALRRIPIDDAPRARPGRRGAALGHLSDDVRRCLGQMADLVDAEAAWAVFQAGCDAGEAAGPPQWFHGDLLPGNVLVQDGKIAGVLDFGLSGVGDPTCDLKAAWALLSSATRPVFREALGVGDATWARERGWALAMGVIAVPYYRHTHPGMFAMGMRTVAQTLEAEDAARSS